MPIYVYCHRYIVQLLTSIGFLAKNSFKSLILLHIKYGASTKLQVLPESSNLGTGPCLNGLLEVMIRNVPVLNHFLGIKNDHAL